MRARVSARRLAGRVTPAWRRWDGDPDVLLDPLRRLRRATGVRIADAAYTGLARAGGAVPLARPERHGLRRLANLRYGPRPEHHLDVVRPAGPGPHPIVVYVHGGSFRALSKDTHWLMPLIFARRGYLVFNVDYRLAPRHRYPAAIEDVCLAWRWIVREAARFDGDPERIALAGESAGGNLVTALTVASCWRRPEPWARAVFDETAPPRAVLPICGVLQVSDHRRLWGDRRMPWWLVDQLAACAEGYVAPGRDLDLADPLRTIEAGAPDRPLPPFFAAVGTRDPLLDDSRRLAAAVRALGGRAELQVHPGEVHAFHAFVWRKAARECWRGQLRFLDETLSKEPPPTDRPPQE